MRYEQGWCDEHDTLISIQHGCPLCNERDGHPKWTIKQATKLSHHPRSYDMTPLSMIAEWRKGCSCAPSSHPERCEECTRALVDALERKLLKR